ncbi:hypothetical protein [Micromonospora sp. Mcm103]|uniref:hypothetical protein n=1 Tax=Micromonospora sp. Mcm103 TaxID=2926015 RepID=UPI0021C84EA3|nr:hypothetical protein [Micromonospora sp. Mcm103]
MTATATTASAGTDPRDFGRPEVQAALDELGQAQQLLAALEERVRDGDPGVQPAELADARQVVEFARLRVDAARRAAERREHDERAAEYEKVGELARAVDTAADQTVVDAFAEAVTALARLWELADQRSRQVRAVASRAAAAVAAAEQHGEREELRAAGVHNAAAGGLAGPASVTVTPEDASPYYLTDVRSGAVLAAALGRVVEVTGADLTELSPSTALSSTARVFPTVAEVQPATDSEEQPA